MCGSACGGCIDVVDVAVAIPLCACLGRCSLLLGSGGLSEGNSFRPKIKRPTLEIFHVDLAVLGGSEGVCYLVMEVVGVRVLVGCGREGGEVTGCWWG